jgi:hypothetical protein
MCTHGACFCPICWSYIAWCAPHRTACLLHRPPAMNSDVWDRMQLRERGGISSSRSCRVDIGQNGEFAHFHRFSAHTREPRRRLGHGTPFSHVVHLHMTLGRPALGVGGSRRGLTGVEQCTLHTRSTGAAHLRTRNTSRLPTRSARVDACCMNVGAVALRTLAPTSLSGHIVHGAAT